MKLEDAILLVKQERSAQIFKHNLKRWHDLEDDREWFIVLAEEFGEVAKEIENIAFNKNLAGVKQRLQKELVQLTTVALAWLSDEE